MHIVINCTFCSTLKLCNNKQQPKILGMFRKDCVKLKDYAAKCAFQKKIYERKRDVYPLC
jgi:hypothetical protein